MAEFVGANEDRAEALMDQESKAAGGEDVAADLEGNGMSVDEELARQLEGLSADDTPTVVILLGMAGSGKTTVMQRLGLWAEETGHASYFVNLDPAVRETFFDPDIDIRDTVDYKEVMRQYELGPNGAIMTSLNLFATRFDQVLDLVKRRAKAEKLDYIFIDTPGQIEVFTWSASGQIISEALAASFPTLMLFCIDTPRCASPTTFMSNMLYACSVLYRSQLPVVCIFNKSDILPADAMIEWMSDYEAFQDALDAEPDGDTGYLGSLNRSLCLVIDEFYRTLPAVPVSAASGLGFDKLGDAFGTARHMYVSDYLPVLRERIAAATAARARREQENMANLQRDLGDGDGAPG